MASSFTVFLAGKQIASGERDEVARSITEQLNEQDGAVLVFEDRSGRITDLDYRDTAPRGAGRPKLGVQAREVTLLPRHWEWLSEQPGGASSALRRLVEDARRKGRTERECPHPVELQRPGALFAPAGHELPVRVELRDPLVLPELGDVVIAVGVLHAVAHVPELPRLAPRLAAHRLE